MKPCFIAVIMIPVFRSFNVIFPQVSRNVAPFHYVPRPPFGIWLPLWCAYGHTLACCLRRLLRFIIRGMQIGMWSNWWMHTLIAVLSSGFKRRNLFSTDNFFCFRFYFPFASLLTFDSILFSNMKTVGILDCFIWTGITALFWFKLELLISAVFDQHF